MWWRWTILPAALLVASCSVPFTQIEGADGRPEYVMKCSGLVDDMRGCARLARELCPRGYHLVGSGYTAYGAVPRQSNVPTDQSGYVHVACNAPRLR
ncbi:MAG TPA: hypothetical protein VMJ73_15170 [Rhizomicrobium sp.]|jgi:hypothetical protein|nr:hypothetical protein [Rhizomicrobium sp.]